VAAAGRAINVVSSGLQIAEKSIARVDAMADDAAALAVSIVKDNATLSMEMDKVKVRSPATHRSLACGLPHNQPSTLTKHITRALN
jgi:hypothetical protein